MLYMLIFGPYRGADHTAAVRYDELVNYAQQFTDIYVMVSRKENEACGPCSPCTQLMGVEIDKTLTMTDWSFRPLSKEKLKYAMDDVRYLLV